MSSSIIRTSSLEILLATTGNLIGAVGSENYEQLPLEPKPSCRENSLVIRAAQ